MSSIGVRGARASSGVSVPLYRVLYDTIRERIEDSTYPPGSVLPSETGMRREFGVSLNTIRRAIHELAHDGLVDVHQGIGSIVREPAEDSVVVVGMSSFTSDVAEGRLRLVRTLMEDKLTRAPKDVAARLGVQVGSMLRHLVRLDCEGGVTFSVDEVYMPPSLADDITPDVAASPLFMHLWQETSKLRLVHTRYDIRVAMPSEADQEILSIGEDVPLLITGELIYDINGRPSVWIETRYRGDRANLSGAVMLTQSETEKGVIGE